MDNLMVFQNTEVEIFELGGAVYFNPYHVGACLGMNRDAVRQHLSQMNDKQAILLKNSDVNLTHIRKLNNAGEKFLTEAGVYKLIFKSRKEEAEKFQDWVTDEVLPQIRKTGSYSAKTKVQASDDVKLMNAQARLNNSKQRIANTYLELSNVDTLSKEYKNILVAKAAEVLNGEELLLLSKSEQKTYSATEIGNMFGVSANRIGKLANSNNLKMEEFGEWYRDKSRYASKEVDSFRYYDTVIPKFEELLKSKLVLV